MGYLTSLSVKNLKRHPIQSLLTIIGIALSVAIILSVFMVNAAMRKSVEKTAEELGTGKTDIWIQELTEDVATIGSRQEGLPEILMNTVMKNPEVTSVHPALKVYTSTKSVNGSNSKEFYLYGIDFISDKTVRNHVLIKGNYPENQQQILIGERFAYDLGLKAGDEFTLPSPKGNLTYKVSGLLSSSEGSGTLNNNRIVFADLKTVQKYFGYEGKITALNIVLKNGVKPSEALIQIKSLLPPNADAFTDPIMDVASSDSTEKLRMMAFIFAFISVFIAVFIIYNTLSSSVEQSRKELGLLRLIGMTNRQVKNYFLIQSLIYSIVGSITGILFGNLLGSGLLFLINRILKFQTFFVQKPSAVNILISVGIGIAATVFVGLLPAIKASKIPPMNVFRDTDKEEKSNKKFISLKYILGIIVLMAGIAISSLPMASKLLLYIRLTGPVFIFISLFCLLDIILPPVLKVLSSVFKLFFGLPGFLAVQSLQLRLKRTVITIGSIAVAVSIFIGFLGATNSMKRTISSWYDTTNWADVLLFSVSGGEIDEAILDRIQMNEYVDRINPMRYHFISYSHEGLSDNGFLFQGVDPEKFQGFTERNIHGGNPKEIISEMSSQPSILINENLSKIIGLKVGDKIKLNTNKGMVDFKVIGLISDYSDFIHRMGKVVYGSKDTLEGLWGVRGYTVIQIKLKDGYSQDFAKRKLTEDLSGQYNIKVITYDEEKKDVSQSADQIFSIIYALNAIILIIVFMGIFNTILINVLFQIKEFAVLRTIGLLVGQIRKLVVCEALAIGIIGTLFASVIGLWFSKQMAIGMTGIMGTVLKYYVPVSTIISVFIATIILSVAATLYPQKIASGISISKVMQSVE